MKSTSLAENLRKPPADKKISHPRASLRNAAEDALLWLRLATWNRLFDGFDRRHGTETGGVLSLKRLGVALPSARYGNRYQPIDCSVFRRALRAIQPEIVPEEFTFVDLGCGKARALILAAGLPFREIVGVEIAPSLVECARRNLGRAAVRNARVVWQSADAFRFPPGPLVVYLFNPFIGPVFRRTMHNLCRSSSGNVWMIYMNPLEKETLQAMRCFKLRSSRGTFEIYQHAPHGAV